MAELGPYVSAFEHEAKNLPFLVKGLSPRSRNKQLGWLLDYPLFAETDFSRFDMSISAEMIFDLEIATFAAFMPNEDDHYMLTALALSLQTKGVSQAGLYYEVVGTRASGDAHTSIGNGIQNYFVTWNALAMYGHITRGGETFRAWRSVHEGDDGIIAFHPDVAPTLNNGLLFSQCLGFSLKVDIYNDINDTSFCGMYLYTDGRRVYSYSDPFRTMSKLHTILAAGDNRTLAVAKCLSILYLNPATPIITEYCRMVIRTVAPMLNTRGQIIPVALQSIKREDRNLNARNILRYYQYTAGLKVRGRMAKQRNPSATNQAFIDVVSKYISSLHDIPDCAPYFSHRTGIGLRALHEYDEYLKGLTYLPAQLPPIPYNEFVLDGEHDHLYFDRDHLARG